MIPETRKLVLGIDFNNMLFGSYYGEKLINSKGMNVNAVKGFFFKMQSLKQIFDPDYIVLANDLSRERTFRRQLYKPYKAQRKPKDPDIFNQMRLTQQMCSLIGYPFINNAEYEADDVLGMLSRFANDNGMDMVIISTDRDLYQLVSDRTVIYNSRSKEMIDRAWMYNKYKLTPEQWIELKILQGDRSDNIPGIAGIGEVTALKLMQQYGSIEGIYSHLGYLKPGLKDTLLAGQSVIPLTRQLVTIVTDYTKLNITEDQLKTTESFPGQLYAMIGELEIPSLLNVMKYSLLVPKEVHNYDNTSMA